MSETRTSTKELVYGIPKLKSPLPMMSCPGCGSPLACKAVMEALEDLGVDDKSICVIGVGCAGMGFYVSKMDAAMAAHGPAPATATGIKHALFDDAVVFTIQGDGDCAAIGAGYAINAAARAEKITVFMLNNSNYGTTGGQMAPTTLLGQTTTTTPTGREPLGCGYPLHMPEMLATIKGVAYCARGAVNTPAHYQQTKKYAKAALQKQIDRVGFSFMEILVSCPVNWHLSPVEALSWIEEKQIAEYPLGEFKNIDAIE
ncbi:MAG: thiamine pyrophosphate-dependent enzyme [Chloroflexota bacterium]|nr:thiamine pyrophosphate-dependent enzyme [Chloroflexota bacterium]